MTRPTDPIQFTRESAERIASVIRATEVTPRPGKPLTFEPYLEGNRARLLVGDFVGPWLVDTFATVTLAGSTVTASVYNFTTDMLNACSGTVVFTKGVKGEPNYVALSIEVDSNAACPTCRMSIASLDLSSLPGYAAGQIQMLGHDAANCLHWYSVTTCT